MVRNLSVGRRVSAGATLMVTVSSCTRAEPCQNGRRHTETMLSGIRSDLLGSDETAIEHQRIGDRNTGRRHW